MKLSIKHLLVVALAIILGWIPLSAESNDAEPKEYKRIVSLLPSVTEVLFALNLESSIVGVTRYCTYPPEAQEKPKVGGFIDVSYESLYSLNPDLVIIQTNSEGQVEKFNEMGIETLQIETRSVDGILESIGKIGVKLNRNDEAKEIIERITGTINSVKNAVEGLDRPSVLVTYYRNVGEGVINEVYIAGNHTYYNELIKIAGGVNAYQGTDFVTSPIITPEGLLSMNPDIIIELMSMINISNVSPDQVLKDWEMLSDLKAYQNKNIYIFNESYSGLPGPRLDMALTDIAHFIHPNLDWKQ